MPLFPFSAVVGQDELRLALQLVVVDGTIGGVLVFGDRGTGKSTTVRALAALLPPMRAVSGCAYQCDPSASENGNALCEDCKAKKQREASANAGAYALPSSTMAVPVVDLPLGATEDRVLGALDLEAALTRGERVFSPGLLARAHRGFLYIDEVNLLPDHIVDLLLDAAASGENVVEREGVSVRHPSRFVLIGSGNPEEGELRPQLLDRFGLSLDVKTPDAVAERVEVVKRRLAFDANPEAFARAYESQESALTERLEKARAGLRDVALDDATLARAATLCQVLGTDGLRAELTLVRAARALASLEGHAAVTDEHLQRVAPLALRHRLRRSPLEEVGGTVRVAKAMEQVFA